MPWVISSSHSRKGGATLFFTTFTRVLLPTTCSPFLTVPVLSKLVAAPNVDRRNYRSRSWSRHSCGPQARSGLERPFAIVPSHFKCPTKVRP